MSDFEKWWNSSNKRKSKYSTLDPIYVVAEIAWDSCVIAHSKPMKCGHPHWAWVEEVMDCANKYKQYIWSCCLICAAKAEGRREAMREANDAVGSIMYLPPPAYSEEHKKTWLEAGGLVKGKALYATHRLIEAEGEK